MKSLIQPHLFLVLASVSIFIGLVAAIPLTVLAHRNGCHAWHSCPSDPGSKKPYICGDTGHCNYCPDTKYCKNKKVRPVKR